MSDETTAEASRRDQIMRALEVLDPLGLVEAAVREQVAREILAVFHRSGRALPSQTVEALRCAARIARGGAE